MCHKEFISILISVSVIYLRGDVRGLEAEPIIGGNDAPPNAFPYHVSILRRRTMRSICGGAIIGDRYVLTAGHCVASANGTMYDLSLIVLSGVTSFDSYPKTRSEIPVEKVFIPVMYKQQFLLNKSGDIAVLRLVRSFNYKDAHWSPLELPAERSDFTNRIATVTGFGWNTIVITNPSKGNYTEDGESYGKLRYAPVKVLDNFVCNTFFLGRALSPKRFCGQMIQEQPNKLAGVCTGDSGGALVIQRRIVIGIASTSPSGCNESHRPGMYTRVSAFVNFIERCKKDAPDPDIISRTLPV
ncbi:hypothetical protein QAD02_015407 [Eretmocerus hayati]|uniref:Uncharacterized protein n=1 Tax=Eretmocerus hayati TaxID=131215 RepID=A0ACC2PCX8_9HYME|nr:hypothetical protein QAD02_015407 [Eretmocerus hayati]